MGGDNKIKSRSRGRCSLGILGYLGLGLMLVGVGFGVGNKGDDKWQCKVIGFESKRKSESIGAFLDHSIHSVPFSIAVNLIAAEPSFELGPIFEYDRTLSLHLVFFERPKVLIALSC